MKQLFTEIYKSQRCSSKKRGHAMPEYSKSELVDWMLSQPNFDTLYSNWKASGCCSTLRPSVDRLDESKGYTFDNIRLVTWQENRNAQVHKTLNDSPHAVHVIRGDGKIYGCIKEAAKDSGTYPSNIIEVCKGKRRTAGRHFWHYKTENYVN